MGKNKAQDVAQSDDAGVQWAPAEKRKRRRWPWMVVPATVAVAGIVAASTFLIAPGVSAADIEIGGLTRDAAARAITDKLATTKLEIKTADGTSTVTGADLGATIDAVALADAAQSDYPLWNVGAWGSGKLKGTVKIDEAKALEALKNADPNAFVDPVDAEVSFDGAAYTVKAAVDGTGLSVDDARDALQSALDTGSGSLDSTPKPIEPRITTAEADAAAATLNGLVKGAGFYVGEENTVPVNAATMASWITFTLGDDGTPDIAVDEAKIQTVVATLAGKIDRKAVNGTDIVDRQGNVLEEGTKAVSGRKLGDTKNVAADFAKQISNGDGSFTLDVKEDKPKVTHLERWIDVNLSTQTVTAYENGSAARSFTVSSGLPGTDTTTGSYRVYAHVEVQHMGSCDAQGNFKPGGSFDYCTGNVPWVMFFNGDEAFHGTYWHNNFGTPMSHGCLNMTIPEAEWLYNWAPYDTEVEVHY